MPGPRRLASGLSEVSSSSSILLSPIPSESAILFSRTKVEPRDCISDVRPRGRSSRRRSGLNRNIRAGLVSSSSTVDSIHDCICRMMSSLSTQSSRYDVISLRTLRRFDCCRFVRTMSVKVSDIEKAHKNRLIEVNAVE